MSPLAWSCGGTALPQDGVVMANHVYSITEVVGTSPDGVEAAVSNAVTQAAKTLRNLDWFEVQSVRGQLTDGVIGHWQVTVKLGFRLEE